MMGIICCSMRSEDNPRNSQSCSQSFQSFQLRKSIVSVRPWSIDQHFDHHLDQNLNNQDDMRKMSHDPIIASTQRIHASMKQIESEEKMLSSVHKGAIKDDWYDWKPSRMKQWIESAQHKCMKLAAASGEGHNANRLINIKNNKQRWRQYDMLELAVWQETHRKMSEGRKELDGVHKKTKTNT